MNHTRIKQAIRSSQWLILPEWLAAIEAIADGDGSFEAMLQQREAYEARHAELLAVGSVESIGPGADMVVSNGTAVIPVIGPVVRYADFFSDISGAATISSLQKHLAAANASSKVERAVLYFDSPGGQANGIAETSRLIQDFSKPIDSYIAHLGASAAYWLPIAAGKGNVYAAPDALVGSIGVRCGKCTGDDSIVSKNAPEKRDSDKGRQQVADDLEEQFIDHVANMRGVSAKTVKNQFGRGGVLLAPAAQEVGMIDHIATLSDLIGPKGQRRKTMTQKSPAASVADDEALSAARADGRKEAEQGFAAQLTEAKGEGHSEGYAAGEKAMQARFSQIFESQAAKENHTLAMHLAFKTELNAEDAISTLEAAGASSPSSKKSETKSEYQKMVDASRDKGTQGNTPDAESSVDDIDDDADHVVTQFEKDAGLS